MKRNCCSTCCREIDSRDFFMESKSGKICSDCLIEAGSVEAESAHLFTDRVLQEKRPQAEERRGVVIALPLKEAL